MTTAQNNLVAWWRCDDSSTSTTVLDSSGNSNNGTSIRNTVDMHTSGKIGGAFNFNGVNDYVELLSFTSVFQDSFTISFWCKPTEGHPADIQTFFGNSDTHGYIQCILLSIGLVRFLYNTENDSVFTDFNANLNSGLVNWFNFIATVENLVDGNIRITLYKDGVLQNTEIGSATMSEYTCTHNQCIGIDRFSGDPVGGGTQFFSGLIDDVRIYDKVLSADEVKQVYNESNSDQMRLNSTGENLFSNIGV
jgi:hypothetical protein